MHSTPVLEPARHHPHLRFMRDVDPRRTDVILAARQHAETARVSSAFSRALQHTQQPIYFCNIQMKHLQRTSKTDKIFVTYV
jgi:hypothetical protein